MKEGLGILLLLVLCCEAAKAQHVGTCDAGVATDTLDVGDVRAALYNTGGFFRRDSGNVYTVPKDGVANSIFAMSLWLGGTTPDGGQRFSGATYGSWEYWPGPLDANGNPPADCTDYDRMYSVYAEDIRAYEHKGTLTADLRDWPYHLGAPVIDGDGITGNYNLAGGDRPHVYGEQSVWWVMNDVGNAKGWHPAPIGLEVQVQAFASSCSPQDGGPNPALDRTVSRMTFYEVTLIHKGQAPLHDVYTGWWIDGDLGNASDDSIGSDTTHHMGYFYNSDDMDEGAGGYGHQPPALGLLHVKPLRFQPTASSSSGLALTNTMFGSEGDVFGAVDDLSPPPWPPNHLRSRWRYGTPLTMGNNGYRGTESTRFVYPGDPVTGSYWSEENTDGNGNPSRDFDRRLVASSGPVDFAPGDTATFTMGLVWAQGRDRLGSVVALRGSAEVALGTVDPLMTFDPYACVDSPAPQSPHSDALGYYILRQNYPEPFSQQTTIRYEVIDTVPVQLNVYDLLGRRVRTLVDGVQDAGVYDVVFEADDLPTGTYFYRLEAAGYVSITRRMVLQR
ncbi:MAG: hypothetical protein RhofKO_12900 [Rhodothermales bacterium]